MFGACGLILTDGTKCEDMFFEDGGGAGILKLGIFTYNGCNNSGVSTVQTWQGAQGSQEVWLKLVEDGTHRTFYLSTCDDFTAANIVRQEATNTFLTPTVVGFGSDTGGSSIPGVYDVLILSFSLVSGVH